LASPNTQSLHFIVCEVSLAREVVKLNDTSDKIAIQGAAIAIGDAAVANSKEAIANAAGGEMTVLNGSQRCRGAGQEIFFYLLVHEALSY
jgi:hypothetical protein